jgi:hypothetical protein
VDASRRSEPPAPIPARPEKASPRRSSGRRIAPTAALKGVRACHPLARAGTNLGRTQELRRGVGGESTTSSRVPAGAERDSPRAPAGARARPREAGREVCPFAAVPRSGASRRPATTLPLYAHCRRPPHVIGHRFAGITLEFQFGAVFSKSVFLQKNRSTLQPGKHVFDGRDSPGLIALG